MNALTVADVYDPIKATTAALNVMAMRDKLEDSKIRNRLLSMQMDDYMKEQDQRRGSMEAIVSRFGAPQSLPPLPQDQGFNAFASGETTPSKKVLAGYDLGRYAEDQNQFALVSKIYGELGDIKTSEQADKYIQSKFPGSPITGEMIFRSAQEHNTDPRLLLALFQHESNLGTKGLATRTRNPGNIGGDNPAPEFYYDDWGKGVDSTSKWLSRHRSVGSQPTNASWPEGGEIVESGNGKMSAFLKDQFLGDFDSVDAARSAVTKVGSRSTQSTQPTFQTTPAPVSQSGSLDYRFGQVLGQQRLNEMERAEQDRIQKLQAAKYKEKMQWWLPAYREFLKSGDNEGLQKFFETSEKDPLLRDMVSKLKGLKLTGPKEGEFQGHIDKVHLAQLTQLASTPALAELVKNSPPGAYHVKFKNEKITEFAPSKDAVGRQSAYDNLKNELGREPTQAEIDDRLFKQGKEGKGQSTGKMTKMQLAYADAKAILEEKGERRDPTPSEVRKSLITLKSEESEAGRPAGAKDNMFQNWTPEQKEIEFEKMLVGGEKAGTRFTGMLATFSQQARGREYNEWLRSKGLTGYESQAIKEEYAAKAKSLRDLEKNRSFIEQSIFQADKNADALLTTSKAFTRTDYPAPNKIVNWWSKNFGSVERQSELGQFGVALLAFSREYMKVVTGSARSVAELSLGAQATADELLSKFDSWGVLEAKVRQAKTEMDNTNKSNIEEIGKVSNELRNFSPEKKPGSGGSDNKPSKGRLTDPNEAKKYIMKAGGDKEKARKLAREDGWEL